MITVSDSIYRNFIKSKLAIIAASVATFATVIPSEAAQVLYSSPTNVSAINDLVVNGITYDVTFKYDTFANLFGLPNSSNFQEPAFWNNSIAAESSAEAIINLFSNEPSIPELINDFTYAYIPYQGIISTQEDTWYIVNKTVQKYQNWTTVPGESPDIFVFSNESKNYAIFTAQLTAQVPEPDSAIVGFALVLGLKALRDKILKSTEKLN
jgi:hypothetical protein